MDNFDVIYKMLKTLENAIDYYEFDFGSISAERLKISECKLTRVWEMLANEMLVYVNLPKITLKNETLVYVNLPRITLKGLEYLHSNRFMLEAANKAKGISG